jgi:hypothetical protein
VKTFFTKTWKLYRRGLKPAFIVGIILGILNVISKLSAGIVSVLLIVDFVMTVGLTTLLWPLMLLWLLILPVILIIVSLG